MDFAAKLLISLVAIVTAIAPMIADFNKTHATNPLWTPHARFHVVWQVLAQAGVSIVILFILWGMTFEGHVWLAAIMNFNWGIAFFATLASMPVYGGALADVNGIPPFRFTIGGKTRSVDTNLFGATMLMGINVLVVILLTLEG
jgi:hypothetical protein